MFFIMVYYIQENYLAIIKCTYLSNNFWTYSMYMVQEIIKKGKRLNSNCIFYDKISIAICYQYI